MSRKVRLAAMALLLSFVVGTAACTDLTGPRSLDSQQDMDWQGSEN
jgi:hypothetical protein